MNERTTKFIENDGTLNSLECNDIYLLDNVTDLVLENCTFERIINCSQLKNLRMQHCHAGEISLGNKLQGLKIEDCNIDNLCFFDSNPLDDIIICRNAIKAVTYTPLDNKDTAPDFFKQLQSESGESYD